MKKKKMSTIWLAIARGSEIGYSMTNMQSNRISDIQKSAYPLSEWTRIFENIRISISKISNIRHSNFAKMFFSKYYFILINIEYSNWLIYVDIWYPTIWNNVGYLLLKKVGYLDIRISKIWCLIFEFLNRIFNLNYNLNKIS